MMMINNMRMMIIKWASCQAKCDVSVIGELTGSHQIQIEVVVLLLLLLELHTTTISTITTTIRTTYYYLLEKLLLVG